MIKGVIFDMDGVISDTQKLHGQVDSQILSEFGIIIPPDELSKRFAGIRNEDYFDALLREKGVSYNLEEIIKDKWRRIIDLSHTIQPIPGARELVKLFSDQDFSLAVASSSNKMYVTTVLEKLGLKDYFSFIATGDMVANGKPDPEIFLLASSNIKVEPVACLVIEDGVSGMQAAKNAGMKCIGLVSDLDGNYPTNNLVKSLEEITLDYLRQI